MGIDVGDRFPVDIAIEGREGPISIAQLIGTGPAVLAFHRLWCPFCQQAARDLESVKAEFDAIGARVAIVYRDDVETVCDSCAQRGITLDCLSDPERELERAAEVERFSVGRYAAFAPARLVRVLRSGSRIGRPSLEILQGRGTFVIDSDARIVYVHRSTTAADIAPVGQILTAARQAAQHAGRRGKSD